MGIIVIYMFTITPSTAIYYIILHTSFMYLFVVIYSNTQGDQWPFSQLEGCVSLAAARFVNVL